MRNTHLDSKLRVRSKGLWGQFGHSRTRKFASYLLPNRDQNQPPFKSGSAAVRVVLVVTGTTLNVVDRGGGGGGASGFQTLTLSLARSLSVSIGDERPPSEPLSAYPCRRLVVAAAALVTPPLFPRSLDIFLSLSCGRRYGVAGQGGPAWCD